MKHIVILSGQIFAYFDSINKLEPTVRYAIDIGLKGLCITDHECISGWVDANRLQDKLDKEGLDFKIGLGDEGYLINKRGPSQKYYHIIWIAKDLTGAKQIKEISSLAWLNNYYDKGERVPIEKAELEEIISKEPGHVIMTTACLGGEVSFNILAMEKARKNGDFYTAEKHKQEIINFVLWAKELFKDDFYFEVAPAANEEQIIVNKKIMELAKVFDVKVILGCDAHYLKKEDRLIHEAFLTSRDAERETAQFYEFAYLQTEEEIKENLKDSILEYYEEICNNSIEIFNKIEKYTLFHTQQIPKVEVKEYPVITDIDNKYETLNWLAKSNDNIHRSWINQCINKLKKINKYNDIYLSRLEEEASVKKIISEKLDTNIFSYPITLQYYIDKFWELGSTVGAGRGSSCSGLNHYLLGITQLDPIEWSLPFWRYLNEDRAELPDIDVDLSPSKRPQIINYIKEERGNKFLTKYKPIIKDNLGCTLVATFGTESSKSAIKTACRGYRSNDAPDGIDVDIAQYISSLVPVERGFVWSIKDVYYGNANLDRNAIADFKRIVDEYPGLLNIMLGIEGLISHRGSHASGVIFNDEDPFIFNAYMRTTSGDITTQFDLHSAEFCGATKYDFLVTEVQDKIIQTIKFLQDYDKIEKKLSLREAYNKYLHPEVLPIEDKDVWDNIQNVRILDLFQFDSMVGSQAAKKIKPNSMLELADSNGLMRLMAMETGETPLEKYVRFKNNIDLWYDEMINHYHLTEKEIEAVKRHFARSHGVPPSQEQLMTMLMDEDICNFTLAEANTARKIVGKKMITKVPELHQKVLNQAKSKNLGKYIWECGIGPQMSYSFSIIHALAYSFIGFQTAYLATRWNPIYWNTACLIVNSGSLEDYSEEEVVDIYELEKEEMENGVTYEDLPDRSGKIKKTSSTDYAKVAKAINNIIDAGINLSLVDINKSDLGFKPDEDNNMILYGMKGLLNVSDDIIKEIISGRPYESPQDFYSRVKPKKQTMISLIKAGAFDNMIDRMECMKWYIGQESDPKKNITLQNMPSLIKYDLVPREETFLMPMRVYEFNRYLKAICKEKDYYKLDERAADFLVEIGEEENIDSDFTMDIKKWDKVYQKYMDIFRKWITDNKQEILKNLNDKLFEETWNTYATGNISSWEMEVMCFYYHEHELVKAKKNEYGVVDFNNLPEEPEIASTFTKGDKVIKLFKLTRIMGTCIAKDKDKGTVTILTTTGVVTLKMGKEFFAMYDRQVSAKGEDGKKKILEKSWFNRGSMIMTTGVRSGDMFLVKKYNSTPGHRLYKIDSINEDGTLNLLGERIQGDE